MNTVPGLNVRMLSTIHKCDKLCRDEGMLINKIFNLNETIMMLQSFWDTLYMTQQLAEITTSFHCGVKPLFRLPQHVINNINALFTPVSGQLQQYVDVG